MTWDRYVFINQIRNSLPYPLSQEVENNNHPLGAAITFINSIMINNTYKGIAEALVAQILPPPAYDPEKSQMRDAVNVMQTDLYNLKQTIDSAGGLTEAVEKMKTELMQRFDSQLEGARTTIAAAYAERLDRVTKEQESYMHTKLLEAKKQFEDEVLKAKAQFMKDLAAL